MATPKCVYDYHQLRQLDPPPFPACDYVFVSGYPDPQNSGLQGFFEWRPHSTDADNAATVIKPASIQPLERGRWHRVFEGAISVKWFGAIGDGNSHPLSTRYGSLVAAQADYPFVTSLNDEIDWAALQAAIAFVNLLPAPAAAQYLIEFPPGTYKVTSTLTPVIANNITFRGSSADACTIVSAASVTLFQWGDASHAVSGGGLQHLGISYVGLTPTDAVAIHQYNATNQLFEDIRIANVWTLYICGTNTTDSGACTFNGVRGYCYYNGSGTPGYALFKLIRVGGISLRNISVEVGGGGPNSPAFPSIEDGNYGTAHMLTSGSPGTARCLPSNSGGSAGGINFLEIVTDTGHGIDTVYMSDIIAQQFTCGVYVYCQNSSAAEFILATNCVWDNCGQTGVLLGGDNSGGWTISNVLLSNCICTGWDGYGVALKQDATGFGYISNVTISGCYTHDTGLEGIYIGSQCRNVDISNPKVENPNRFSGGTAAGIRVQIQTSDLSITGGTVGGNFNGTTTLASIGLAIEPGCMRFAVSGGTYRGITYGLSLGASGDAYDIQGTFKGGTAPLQIVGTDPIDARNRRIRLANQLAVGDGTTDDQAALAAGDAAVPYGFHHRLERGTYHIANALTFSNELEFGVGAVLDPGPHTLGFQSPINVPPMQQIFLPSATAITLQGNRGISPKWFGAKGDGVTDDRTALLAASNAAAASRGFVELGPGIYRVASAVSIGQVRLCPLARLKPDNCEVTVRGVIAARDQQIVDTSANGNIAFPAGSIVWPAWWGAGARFGSTDDGPLFQRALECCTRPTLLLEKSGATADYTFQSQVNVNVSCSILSDHAVCIENLYNGGNRGGADLFYITAGDVTIRGLRFSQDKTALLTADVRCIHVFGGASGNPDQYLRNIDIDDINFADMTNSDGLEEHVSVATTRLIRMQGARNYGLRRVNAIPTIYDGTTKSCSGLGIYLIDCDDGAIENCHLYDTGWCSLLFNSNCHGATVRSCAFAGKNPNARYQGGAANISGGSGAGDNSNITFEDCDFEGPTLYTGVSHLRIGTAHSIKVIQCRFRGATQQYVLSVGTRGDGAGGYLAGCKDVLIQGCTIETTAHQWCAILIDNKQTDSSDTTKIAKKIRVIGNDVTPGPGGIASSALYINGAEGGLEDVVLEANNFESYGYATSFPDPEVPPSVGAVLVANVIGFVAEGNTIRWAGSGSPDGSQYGFNIVNGRANLTIADATNASPIVITTSSKHGLATGAKVSISGVVGNTAPNDNWTITKLSDTTFSLDGSAGNGPYTSGGTIMIAASHNVTIRNNVIRRFNVGITSTPGCTDLRYLNENDFVENTTNLALASPQTAGTLPGLLNISSSSIAAGATQDFNVSVPGVVPAAGVGPTSGVTVNAPAAVHADLSWNAFVSAANQITLRVRNNGASARSADGFWTFAAETPSP
jgi:hypothetical protein